MTEKMTIPEMLESIFSLDSELYQGRGFMRRIGYGERPALVIIDLANAWTRPGSALSCDEMDDVIIPGVQRLLEASRAKGLPIAYTTMGYTVTEGPNTDTGVFGGKVPLEGLQLGTDAVEIDERIAPQPNEQVIVKKWTSGFHGTNLLGFLNGARVDTVIVTGVTAAGCVRHTVEDAICYGFRPIIVRECVGDRVPGVTLWNLFDMDAKFGDVEPLEAVLDYLERLPVQSGAAEPAIAR